MTRPRLRRDRGRIERPRLPAQNRPRRRRVAAGRLRRQPAPPKFSPFDCAARARGERGGGGGRLRAMSRRGARASARYRRRSGRRIRPRRRRLVLVGVFRIALRALPVDVSRRTIDRRGPGRGRLRAFVHEQTFIHPRRIRARDAELRGESRDRVHERSRRSLWIKSLRPALRVMRGSFAVAPRVPSTPTRSRRQASHEPRGGGDGSREARGGVSR